MWLNLNATRTFNLVITILLCAFISGCDGVKFDQPYIVSFDTNGIDFAYSTPGIPTSRSWQPQKIFIVDKDGNTQKVMEAEGLSLGYVHYGKSNFYYVLHDGKKTISKIIRCNLKYTDCSPIVEMSGSIKFPIELDDNSILFERSNMNPKTHKISGYANFHFYKYEIDIAKLTYIVGQGFASIGAVYKVGPYIYYSGTFDQNIFFFKENGEVLVRNDFYFDLRKNTATKERKKFDINGSFNIISNIAVKGNTVYYLGDDKSGRYIYKTCFINALRVENCSKKSKTTTSPAFANGKMFYGIWNADIKKMKFFSVNL